MIVIIGASGQVGGMVAQNLSKMGQAVTGVVRSEEKAAKLKENNIGYAIADAMQPGALDAIFAQVETVFLITPETGESDDVLGDTAKLLANYRKAIEGSNVKKIVGLSSIGAQFSSGTGNLQMSYMLEHAFSGLAVSQIFIRPSYYFSNWLLYAESVENRGILPSLYPDNLSISMNDPADVAEFVAKTIVGVEESKVFELLGPEFYTPNDVAEAFSLIFKKPVKTSVIPREGWESMLEQAGFSPDAVKNFVLMTELVVNGSTVPEVAGTEQVRLKTTLLDYLRKNLS